MLESDHFSVDANSNPQTLKYPSFVSSATARMILWVCSTPTTLRALTRVPAVEIAPICSRFPPKLVTTNSPVERVPTSTQSKASYVLPLTHPFPAQFRPLLTFELTVASFRYSTPNEPISRERPSTMSSVVLIAGRMSIRPMVRILLPHSSQF